MKILFLTLSLLTLVMSYGCNRDSERTSGGGMDMQEEQQREREDVLEDQEMLDNQNMQRDQDMQEEQQRIPGGDNMQSEGTELNSGPESMPEGSATPHSGTQQ